MIQLVVSVIFIILLFSILASTIQEMLAGWLSLRGAMLMRTLHHLFEGEEMKKLYARWVSSPDFGFLLKQPSTNFFGRTFDALAKRVRALMGVGIPVPEGISDHKKEQLELPPSYISSDAFLLMLEHIHLDEKSLDQLEDSFLKKLLLRIKKVQDKPEELRKEFEKWYDEIMGRLTEAYKRHIQVTLFLIGCALAVVFNANLITLFKGLSQSPADQGRLYDLAIRFAAENDTLPVYQVADTSLANSIVPKFDSAIFIPVNELRKYKSLGLKSAQDTSVYTAEGIRKNIAGWLFMALAISFGAPFWFDFLKKVVNFRL